jgi:hypothetical protein
MRWFGGFGAGGGGTNRLIGWEGAGFGGEALVFCDIRDVQYDQGSNHGVHRDSPLFTKQNQYFIGSIREGVSCDESGCVTQLADGGLVALALKPDALSDDCARAALLVTARQPPPSCPSAVIEQPRLQRQGAMALWRTGHGFAADAVRPKGFDRPWSPAVPGDTDPEPSLERPAAPRAVDATPSEADLQAEE